MLGYNRNLKKSSQQLRNEMTNAERLLWSKIRHDKIKGLRFYRQKTIGKYIADFFCPKTRLIIEIDGGQHYEVKGEAQDKVRDEYLKSLGLKVLRFQNIDVLKNIDGVILGISEEINLPF